MSPLLFFCPFSSLLPTPLSSTLLHSTLLYSTLLHSTLLYSTPLSSTILYSTLLYSTLLYSTILVRAMSTHYSDATDLAQLAEPMKADILSVLDNLPCALAEENAAAVR